MDPAAAAYELVQDALLTPHSRINLALTLLPILQKDDVDLEEQCPICLMSFATIFAEQQEAPQHIALGGLTKLGCGHVFCRRDLTEWIRSLHGNCPTCRHTFLNIRPHSDSDDESSDGGEYIPNLEDPEDDDEDAFLDSIDGLNEADTDTEDFIVHGMDVDGMWAAEETSSNVDRDAEMDDQDISEADVEEDGSSEWGLTDGESESMSSSNGDLSMGDEADDVAVASGADVIVSVQGAEADANASEERECLVPHDIGSDDQDPK